MARRRAAPASTVAPAATSTAFVAVDDLAPLALDDAEVERLGVQRAARDAVGAHPSVLAERETRNAFERGRSWLLLWERTEAAWRSEHPGADGWPSRAVAYSAPTAPSPF